MDQSDAPRVPKALKIVPTGVQKDPKRPSTGRGRVKPLSQGILGKRGVDGTMGTPKPPIAQRAGGIIWIATHTCIKIH